MLRTVLGFFRGLWTLAWPWRLWVGALIVANGVLPLLFWERPEAKAILGVFLIGALVQMILFRLLGFVRFLGIGHILVWVPLLPWLWTQRSTLEPGTPLARWLLAVIVLDALSLVIDFVDVARYLHGDRTPALTVDDL